LHNLAKCHSEWSESCPDRLWVGGGMKNLKTGIYTEFKDILNGSHFRFGELNMTILGFVKVPKNFWRKDDRK